MDQVLLWRCLAEIDIISLIQVAEKYNLFGLCLPVHVDSLKQLLSRKLYLFSVVQNKQR